VPAVLSDPVVDVVAAVDKLRADDRLIMSPEMLLGDLEAIFDSVSMLRAVAVRRLREARDMEATAQLCGRSPKRWLVEEALLAGPDAGRLMRLLHALPAHPLTEAAFDDGQINDAHASAIVTALATLPEQLRDAVEPHLVERAKTHPPEEIAGLVDELLDALGLDKDSDARRERRYAQRGLDVARTLHGTRSVAGTLSPEVGEHLEQALALAGPPAGTEDKRSARQRQHDALGVIVAAYLASHGTPSFTGAPRTVIVTIDLDTLEGRLRDAWVTMPSGAVISADTARRLACDARIVPAVLGSTSEVLDIGQADSEFTVAIRRAAYLRDGGRCAFPGCRNRVTELHHIIWRSNRGPTSLDNAAWLCQYHHWLAHDGHWTLRRQPDGSYLWTSPHGRQRTRDPSRE
jgi:hypothetical protein